MLVIQHKKMIEVNIHDDFVLLRLDLRLWFLTKMVFYQHIPTLDCLKSFCVSVSFVFMWFENMYGIGKGVACILNNDLIIWYGEVIGPIMLTLVAVGAYFYQVL